MIFFALLFVVLDIVKYRVAQLCGVGTYWQIALSPRIGGEIFGDFVFKSKDTQLVRKHGR